MVRWVVGSILHGGQLPHGKDNIPACCVLGPLSVCMFFFFQVSLPRQQQPRWVVGSILHAPDSYVIVKRTFLHVVCWVRYLCACFSSSRSASPDSSSHDGSFRFCLYSSDFDCSHWDGRHTSGLGRTQKVEPISNDNSNERTFPCVRIFTDTRVPRHKFSLESIS